MSENTKNQSKTKKGLLFLHALTSLHPGSGTALGAVDLPVQRERHTMWPVIPGSSLKGVIRDACRPETKDKESDEYQKWLSVFGPEAGEGGSDHAGAISMTDARILAFPVRSLKGVFAWVTCPSVLRRFKRDLKLAEKEIDWIITEIKPASDNEEKSVAAFSKNSPLRLDNQDVIILEEYEFWRHDTIKTEDISESISNFAITDKETRESFKKHFVILPDDDFTYFTKNATEVHTRIMLNYETKTVKGTNLFSEESLPAETLFYSVVFAEKSRFVPKEEKEEEKEEKSVPLTPTQVMKHIYDNTPEYIQIGGDATIGKGFCSVKKSLGVDKKNNKKEE